MDTAFWKKRLIFFVTIWSVLMLISALVILSFTNEVSATFWEIFTSIALRGFINFGSYIIIFSIAIYYLSKRFPLSTKIPPKRLFLNLLILLITAIIFAKINTFIQVPRDFMSVEISYPIAFIITFFQAGMVFAVLEIWEFAQRNQSLEVSLAQLEKEKLATQLLALQQKVNPHFLFNSLNVLSELMHEDLEKADQFITHFSNIYRYVLDLNEEAVVSLKQELSFLESYLFLQKIRFGENLKITQDIDATAIQSFVPPLSLQLLFENAIKHNTISKEYPLHIYLKNKASQLLIINNLQNRKTKPIGTGTGLQNLKEKYRLISDQAPRFTIENGEYIAAIPLLKLEA